MGAVRRQTSNLALVTEPGDALEPAVFVLGDLASRDVEHVVENGRAVIAHGLERQQHGDDHPGSDVHLVHRVAGNDVRDAGRRPAADDHPDAGLSRTGAKTVVGEHLDRDIVVVVDVYVVGLRRDGAFHDGHRVAIERPGGVQHDVDVGQCGGQGLAVVHIHLNGLGCRTRVGRDPLRVLKTQVTHADVDVRTTLSELQRGVRTDIAGAEEKDSHGFLPVSLMPRSDTHGRFAIADDDRRRPLGAARIHAARRASSAF